MYGFRQNTSFFPQAQKERMDGYILANLCKLFLGWYSKLSKSAHDQAKKVISPKSH